MGWDARATANLPIVGKAFEILRHYPTVVIQCRCEAQRVLVLVGRLQIVECDACHRQFAIADNPKVTVGVVRTSIAPARPEPAAPSDLHAGEQ